MSYHGSDARDNDPSHPRSAIGGVTDQRPAVPRAVDPFRTGRPPTPPRRPRVGHIAFLNCLPLLWGLGRTGALVDMDLRMDSPDRLSAALVAGELDISPISLFEFLKHADNLVILPDLAIGCDGPVTSCLIFSRLPLDRLDREPVALGSMSRTSARLAQLLLSDAVRVQPEYQVCPPDLQTMMRQASAAVLIGDTAMYARREAPALGLEVHDLGQMWRDWTGLPFVFAVFAARRDFVEHRPDLVRQTHAHLLAARDESWSELDVVCDRAARWTGFAPDMLRDYYTEALDFTLGERQLAGITEFAHRVGCPRPELPPQSHWRCHPETDRKTSERKEV
jgi:chorismate dehydratase